MPSAPNNFKAGGVLLTVGAVPFLGIVGVKF